MAETPKKLTTKEDVRKDVTQKIHDAGLDLFGEPIDLGQYEDKIAEDKIVEGIRIAYDMPDMTLLGAIRKFDVPLYEYDDSNIGTSFYHFMEHFKDSGETESVIETAIFMGDTRAIVDTEKLFKKDDHAAWHAYMDRLNAVYDGPDLFKYRLMLLGFECTSDAVNIAWKPEKRAKAFKDLQK